MKRLKFVYICDNCGEAALQERYYFMEDSWVGPPDGWHRFMKMDLCPVCSEVYARLRDECEKEKEKNNAEN